jgi:hypothetical protein
MTNSFPFGVPLIKLKYLTALLLAITTYSCTIVAVSPVGKYHNRGNFENGAELQLFRDSTYVYHQQAGLVFFSGKGLWKLNNDTLILMNTDTTISEGTPIGNQLFIIRSNKLEEIPQRGSNGPTLKRTLNGR